jgi:hypothetical protein
MLSLFSFSVRDSLSQFPFHLLGSVENLTGQIRHIRCFQDSCRFAQHANAAIKVSHFMLFATAASLRCRSLDSAEFRLDPSDLLPDFGGGL